MPLHSDLPLQPVETDASDSAAPTPRLTDSQKAELCSPDILSNILKHLSEVDIANTGQTSRIAHQALAQDALWTDKLNKLRQVDQTIPDPDDITPGTVKATFDLHFQAMRARQLQEISFFQSVPTNNYKGSFEQIKTALKNLSQVSTIDNLDTLIRLETLLVQLNIDLIKYSLGASAHRWGLQARMQGDDQDIYRTLKIANITRFPDSACAHFTDNHAKAMVLNISHNPLLSSLPEEIFLRCPNFESFSFKNTSINEDTLPERIRVLPRFKRFLDEITLPANPTSLDIIAAFEKIYEANGYNSKPKETFFSSAAAGATAAISSAALAASGAAASAASAAGATLKSLFSYKRTFDEVSDGRGDATQEQTDRPPVSNPALKAEASSDDDSEPEGAGTEQQQDDSRPKHARKRRRHR